ncbi:hypothetical protein O8C99_03120 [Aliarcobacter butzleri]|uniref:Highly acidic protein n=2 Tax=Aliarcobacter butzleri TaxID=28197 RepID=A0AAW7PZV1_9BACT|nr:hypothetical protein [Aliarcobacter butzleri]KLD98596.1 hypothetical protein AA20_08465 [Aliarcobacter butzleri L348]MCG3666865.1 hypothetical protein [Aliarcobacter butzleri]MDN5071221.1 hypothetical protein [Aliarcobacter butzleri]MDN5102171.1 hypothetical protein [Aliarcobacter butzleri]MDN5127590.1 hypothetical protein [Aliarcobacter butzleri]
MNIYIYGNQRFKKEIYKILDSSQIKKIDNNVIIKEISNLNDLKETIKAQPKDIYLIDDEKIIKKDSLKSKFFAPKDGIDEQFLVESGVNDLTINSLNEIPEYIIRKYELEKNLEDIKKENKVELDDELSKLLANETQIEKKPENIPEIKDDEIISGVNLNELENLIETTEETENIDLHKLDNNDKIANEFEDFNNDFGLNNISFDYDDDNILNDNSLSDEDVLSQILNSASIDEDNYEFLGETFEDVNFLEELFPDKAEFLATFEKPEKQVEDDKTEMTDEFVEFDDDEEVHLPDEEIQEVADLEEDNFENEKKEVIIEPMDDEEDEESEKFEDLEGENMNDNEFSELDSLNEKDLMEALNYKADEIVQVPKNQENTQIISNTNNKETVILNSSNVDEISQLISKLLSNKTLEITIKLKD